MLVNKLEGIEKNEPLNEVISFHSYAWWYGRLVKILTFLDYVFVTVIEKLNSIGMYIIYRKTRPDTETLEEFYATIEAGSLSSEKKIEEYKSKIHTFDAFILKNHKLNEVFNCALNRYGQFVSKTTVRTYTPNTTDSVIERWSKVKGVEIDLEHVWSQRIKFVLMHDSVREAVEVVIRKISKKKRHSEFEQKVLSLVSDFHEKSRRPGSMGLALNILG